MLSTDTATRGSAAPSSAHPATTPSAGASVAEERPELVARAAELRPLLAEDAAQADRLCRLTDRVGEGITQAGLMRMTTPRRAGGHGADARTLLDVTTTLGGGCCSAAWVTGVLNVGNFVVSLFPEEAQDEVWADNPDARTAQVLGRPAPDVESAPGGVVVSGQWAYMSGSTLAEWVGVLLARGPEGGAPGPYFALLPRADLDLKDTWHVTGMRGTGSNTFVARGVFVPAHRLLPYGPVLRGELTRQDAATPYRNSLTGMFSLGLLGSLIGGADAALRLVRDKAPERPVAGSTYASQADSPTAQLYLADAAARTDSAKLHARRLADCVDEYALAERTADTDTRARCRMDSARVAELCREAVDTLVTAYGSSAFQEGNPLQRIWRDVHVGSRHAGFGMGIPQQLYGRSLVGKDPREVSLLV
ncbi:acyl-CoA dehydrogenase family protein [Streptomyces sp. NPDC058657]|uniref:acyl-CoA dehydrogenase family protein n=1 Tax=unclassified Streptomyces TaxID=2593676 RepID=UPI003661240D